LAPQRDSLEAARLFVTGWRQPELDGADLRLSRALPAEASG
jgi:hypothetical protein